MQLGGFWLSMCIFSARGGSRNYRIGRVGGGQSLIDILLTFTYFLLSVSIQHSNGTLIYKEGGDSKF